MRWKERKSLVTTDALEIDTRVTEGLYLYLQQKKEVFSKHNDMKFILKKK